MIKQQQKQTTLDGTTLDFLDFLIQLLHNLWVEADMMRSFKKFKELDWKKV